MFNLSNGFRTWWGRRTAIAKLHRLDDHLLADLGVERECIAEFVARQAHDPATRRCDPC